MNRSQKIGSVFIPTLNKPETHTFNKDSGKRDFVNAIQRANSTKLAPNHYKPFDEGGFSSKDNLKKVKFAFTKDAKASVIEAMAKKKAWVPGANFYNPSVKRKTLGNYLQ